MLNISLNIYSGRPDPSWTLTQDQTKYFTDYLKEAQVSSNNPKESPEGSRYRGFTIGCNTNSNYLIRVYDGFVIQGEKILIDDARKLEFWLLETAPENIVNINQRQYVFDHYE
jgi:hypothetical protein